MFRCLDSFTLGNVQLDHRVTVMLIVLHDTPLGPIYVIVSLTYHIYPLYDQLLSLFRKWMMLFMLASLPLKTNCVNTFYQPGFICLLLLS